MKRYDSLRLAARRWRGEGLALQEICERLSLSKGTVYHWIKDLPLARESRSGRNFLSIRKRPEEHWRLLREEAYRKGSQEFPTLATEPFFRDFVVLYLTEGYRRDRNQVSVCNSNPALIRLAAYWFRRMSMKRWGVWVQVYEDQDLPSLVRFWSELLGVAPDSIRLQKKLNSGNLSGRRWRSVRGVITLRVNDTYFRARLQAWMVTLEREWNLQGVA